MPVNDIRPHYVLDVPDYGREWLTANQRLFWRVRAARTRDWREVTGIRARQDRIPRLQRAWVVCELRFSDNRRRDPANWAPTAKACVDGLVDAGVFVDDDSKHVIGPDMRLGPVVPVKERGVRIYIYPTEE